MIDEDTRRREFAAWLNQELQKRGWTQGKLIAQSGSTDDNRLSSATVSRYSTGKMLPDVVSSQRIARAFDLPVELVLRKTGLIDPLSSESDWVQQAIDALANAVEAGQLSEEGRQVIIAQIRRERRLQELEQKKKQ
ncbi:MAG TPA: helix-turn-helix transcriptional regulator [Ktedonobacteraceae bacterium]|nr:helix-turn-helix transcriptional regulator [Ktedonobacteraceae bacterium]